MKSEVFILTTKLSQLNSFSALCEDGIDIEETQEEERIGPNYMKLVQRLVYLLAKVGSNNNNSTVCPFLGA